MVLPVNCFKCGKKFFRPSGRFNEAIKFGWNQFCSDQCRYSSKVTKVFVDCARRGCNKKVFRVRNQFLIFNKAYCSRRCSAIVNNSEYPKHPGVIKKCAYCGKDFKSRLKYCSVSCRYKDTIIPREILISKIKKFVEKYKRIPLKMEVGSYHTFRKRFGSWNKAIIAAGYNPNPVMFAKKHVANDGHICDSLSERIIDDFLSRRKIGHEINVPYPGRLKFTADFKIGNYWIEYFGLKGKLKHYDDLRNKKLRLARRNNLDLIKIYPKDLFPKGRLTEIFNFL